MVFLRYGAMIKLTHGDLLKEQVDAIVNTVNCVGIMGKGIALQFKKKWPENFKAYSKACKKGEIKPGKVFVYNLTGISEKPQYIVNFPTKNHWREKSKLSYIEEGLNDLKLFIQNNNIKSIAIPPLGCGNGCLEWSTVKIMIENAFSSLENIDVHLFEPGSALSAKNMVINTKKPALTLGRAILIKLISIYREMEYSLSKLEIQKLCYFGQELGLLSKLNFKKNQFGPYAHNLRHVLDQMDGHYIFGIGDHDSVDAQISLMPDADNQADHYLDQNLEIQHKLKKLADLIEGFESPYGMELLSTVYWAAKHSANNNDVEMVIQTVYNWEPTQPDWNQRKQHLMKKSHIKTALEHIKQQGWLL